MCIIHFRSKMIPSQKTDPMPKIQGKNTKHDIIRTSSQPYLVSLRSMRPWSFRVSQERLSMLEPERHGVRPRLGVFLYRCGAVYEPGLGFICG